MARDRRDLLETLLTSPTEVEQTVRELAAQPWDSSVELVVLSRSHIISVLKQFLDRTMDAHAMEEWANALEARDDVGLEPGYDELLKNAIFRLANPVLEGNIADESVHSMLSELTS